MQCARKIYITIFSNIIHLHKEHMPQELLSKEMSCKRKHLTDAGNILTKLNLKVNTTLCYQLYHRSPFQNIHKKYFNICDYLFNKL